MNKKVLTIVLSVALVALLIIAGVWYNKLSRDYEEPTAQAPAESQGESEAPLAVDFTVYDAEGNKVSLSDKFGKPIVVNFWASWCGPCTMEMPAFQTLYNEYGEEVEFMMVNLTAGRETVETANDFLELAGLELPVYYDLDMSAVMAYTLNSIPRTFFINSDGTVYGSHLGAMSEDILRNYVEKLTE